MITKSKQFNMFIFGTIVGLLLLLISSFPVCAESFTEASALANALNGKYDNGVITIAQSNENPLGNITYNGNETFTIDIQNNANLSFSTGSQLLFNNGTVTIQGNGKISKGQSNVPLIQLSGPNVNLTVEGNISIESTVYAVAVYQGSFTLESGSVVATDPDGGAILTHGTQNDPPANITIKSGTVKGGSAGIYTPSKAGNVTILGGDIIGGESGIEIRGGQLNVQGGTITCTGDKFTVSENGSGTTLTGTGIAVSPYSGASKRTITVNITGGTISGPTTVAYAHANPGDYLEPAINTKISGGTFKSTSEGKYPVITVDQSIDSDNLGGSIKEPNFITGGTFNGDVTEYMPAGMEYYQITDKDGDVLAQTIAQNAQQAQANIDVLEIEGIDEYGENLAQFQAPSNPETSADLIISVAPYGQFTSTPKGFTIMPNSGNQKISGTVSLSEGNSYTLENINSYFSTTTGQTFKGWYLNSGEEKLLSGNSIILTLNPISAETVSNLLEAVYSEVPVTGININTYLNLSVGRIYKVNYTFSPEGAYTEGATLKWNSSNPNIATVSNEGIVTAKAVGQTLITASYGTVTSNSCIVTVTTPTSGNNPGNGGNNNPSTPDKPDEPDTPDEPGTPDTPNEPSKPDNGFTWWVPGAEDDSNTTPPSEEKEVVTVYRLYNVVSDEHLYTTSMAEVQALTANSDWRNEGPAWEAPKTGVPVYRLYNPATGLHLYTTDTNEVSVLTQSGWLADNSGTPVFYSGGDVPVYRLYNPATLQHLLTTDSNEYQILGQQGWTQEGIALYAVSNQ